MSHDMPNELVINGVTYVRRVDQPDMEVLASVCEEFGAPCAAIRGERQCVEIMALRHLITRALADRHGWSAARIARAMNKDHTTISASLKRTAK